MKKCSAKKILLLVNIFIILLIICCFQFFTKPDVLNSSIFSSVNESSENIDVILNRVFIFNKNTVADELLEMRLTNSFHSIMFSNMSPEKITFTVYTNKIMYAFHKEGFSFSCSRDGDDYTIEIGE